MLYLQNAFANDSDQNHVIDKCIHAYVTKGNNQRFTLLKRFVNSYTSFSPRWSKIQKSSSDCLIYKARCARVYRMFSKNETKFDLMAHKF